ncbi:hypothetical protein [Synechococcus sp. Cu2B8-bc1011]|uniref:hypothetical protein n=1 Tax=Synechococcus sp. Cu2B8-bc1011 TaxID=3093725 RepID=UPI0039B066D5
MSRFSPQHRGHDQSTISKAETGYCSWHHQHTLCIVVSSKFEWSSLQTDPPEDLVVLFTA